MRSRRKLNSTEKNPVLRQHQIDALVAIKKVLNKGEGRGRIVLPTGTGKTRVEAETICEMIKRSQKVGVWGGVHVVLSPRILLAYQQLNEFLNIISKNGFACEYMVVNSGGLDSTKYEKELLTLGFDPKEIDSTTTTATIINNVNTAKRDNLPLVIFSTYHSVDRVDSAEKACKTKIQS